MVENGFTRNLPWIMTGAGIFLTLLINIGGVVWWMSSEGEKVNNLDKAILANQVRVEAMQTMLNIKSEDLVSIKSDIKHLAEAVANVLIDRKETIDHLKVIEDYLYRKNTNKRD